ncbi:MAG TPA: hypothetical protein VNL70_00155 [Tepidisphaeraceae bacterium]|nr:hypothetical protein [Tepidisphaeraceae bacterium]
MGLAVVVGIVAQVARADPEAVEHYREEFARINEVLVERGLPEHTEPEELPALANRCSLESYPYSFLHSLRRVYAHRVRDAAWVATPVLEQQEAMNDPLVEEVTMEMTSHLLCHSDAEGYYLPIDFDEILFDEQQDRITGGMLGSSYRLRDELLFVAPALGINVLGKALPDSEADRITSCMEQEGPLWIEKTVWLSLFEAARLSIQHRAAICFT